MADQDPLTLKPPTQKSEKTLGYMLLVVGLLIITFATIYAVLILTGNIKPAKVFTIKAPEIPTPSLGQSLDPEALQDAGVPPQLLNSLTGSKNQTGIKILPDEVFTDLVNMGVAYILVMILASSGSKFASIGVQLIKEIKVQTKS